jgi:hypothetical protein
MKNWHVNCDVCKRPGPTHENPIESIRLAEDQGWGQMQMGVLLLSTVCPDCLSARSFGHKIISPQTHALYMESSQVWTKS